MLASVTLRQCIAALGLLLCLCSEAVNAETYLTLLQQQAEKLQLSGQRTWQVLLHYSPNIFSAGVTSQVDDEKFFLHPLGKTNPQAELRATLHSFFLIGGDDTDSTQCLFPARFAWLVKSLAINVSRLPDRNCQNLQFWLHKLAVNSVTLIFPVAYLNNPASMFGHTLLRLDSYGKRQTTDLLAWTVNYAADTDLEHGIEFAAKGLFGGYQGKFSLAPYYFKVQEYGDLESRDIWEYQLNFTANEIQAMLLHLWELLPVHFDYFFIDENCAYQLLALLEAARPEMRLTRRFQHDAIPADTVHAITTTPGLLKHARYRPSRRTLLNARTKRLNPSYQRIAKSLGDGLIQSTDAALTALSTIQQAQILDLALEYLSYKNAGDKHQKHALIQQRLYQLLLARNTLSAAAQIPDIDTPSVRPDQGHPGNRIAFSYGHEDPGHFLELEFRWAYHDLIDPQGGFIPGAKLEFFKPALRYYPQHHKFQLEKIDFINIKSLPVRNLFIKPFAWQARISLTRQRLNNKRPLMGEFRTGLGINLLAIENTLFSVSALGSIVIGDPFEQYLALGAGAEFFLQHDFTANWRSNLSARVLQYIQGIKQTAYELTLQQRFTLNRVNAIVFKLSRKNEFSSSFWAGQVSWRYYF